MDVSPEAFAQHIAAVREKSTARRYKKIAMVFLQFCARQGIELHRAPPGLLGQYAATLARAGLSPATIHVHATGTKRYLEWRRSLGDQVSMMSRPDLPKVMVPIPDALDATALRSYLAAANELDEPMRTALLILPYCGLRCAELVALRIDSVRTVTDRGKFRVHFQVRGKGRKERAVPVLEECYGALRAYLRGWRASRRTTPWLFPQGTGAPLRSRQVARCVEGIRSKTRLRALTPHTLRRTFATNLYLMGVDPVTIAFILGHSSPATTKKHYLAAGAPALWQRIELARSANTQQE